MNEKVRIFLAVFISAVIAAFPAAAENGIYTIGGKAGWNTLSSAENITWIRGEEGCDAWMIADRELPVLEDTDVLLNCNGPALYDAAGHYTISGYRRDTVQNADRPGDHGSSLLFRGNGGVTLSGRKDALFGNQGLTGSFTIGFWINPAVVDSGEQLFSWHSSRNLSEYSLYQMIVASFENNHMVWQFTNLFDAADDENHSVQLAGKTVIVPGTWSLHQLVYNDETGLLEYLVNGRIEDMTYVTDTGRETGSVWPAHLGVTADITLCPSYAGYLDEFIIIRRAVDTSVRQEFLFDRYPVQGGSFTTGIFSVCDEGAKIQRIAVSETIPEQTDTSYYIRWSNQNYGWTDEEPAWHPFTAGELLTAAQSGYHRYFQIKADLFTDGLASRSPVISGFSLQYESREVPFAPYGLDTVPGNGSVTLSWKPSPSGAAGASQIGGYLVYYGERPGEYLGTAALEGTSPIDFGNRLEITVTGLKNGRMYYFAVCAYSADEPVLCGPLSQEVYCRPGSKKN